MLSNGLGGGAAHGRAAAGGGAVTVRRWDTAIAYLGSGEYEADIEENDDGEYVLYVDHMGATYAAVRQTQRRMIAALYWRAGHYEIEARRPLQSIHMEARMRGAAFAMERTARAMEAAL